MKRGYKSLEQLLDEYKQLKAKGEGWKPYKVRRNVNNIDGIITRRLVEEGFMVRVSKGVYKISPDLLLSHGRIVKIGRSEKSDGQ